MTASRLNADARHDQILEVAIEVFGRAGYFGASMNEIADAAGVTKPVLYQHFDSKRELYRSVLEEVGSRMIDEITKATADATTGKEQTEQGFLAYFRWVARRHDDFNLLFGGSARSDAEFAVHIQRVTDEAAAAIAPLIDAGIDAAERDMLAHALVGLAEGASRQLVARGEAFDPDEAAREVSALAWAGLRALDKA